MLIKDTKNIYRHIVERELGKNATGKQVLDHLFGTYDNDYQPETNFVIKEWCKDDKTPLQRFNMFWAIPLTLLCAPYQYIFNGHVGWDTKSSFGVWILKVTGHLKEGV